MRRAALLLLAGLMIAPAAAAAQGTPSAGGLASADVEYVGTVPLQGRSNGGRLVGRHFYVTTGKDLTILDVSDPEAPRQVGYLEFDPVDVYYQTGYQENPDTNGKILIRHGDFPFDPGLHVVDVRDPANPTLVATADVLGQHTVSCVLDCTWAYGSEGQIVDLRDPAAPKEAGDWRESVSDEVEVGSGHDVTEVAPGLVLTATEPILLLDARSDPSNPTVLAATDAPGFVHGVLWPKGAKDAFALGGGEAFGPGCSSNSSATFYTYDTRGWETSHTFRLLAEWGMRDADPQNGSTFSAHYCTHWFDHHPAFRGGGLVAIAWYEQGTRLLRVASDGGVEEVGWFLPWSGSTWSAHWISDRIVYAADHNRGIDILRWTGDIPAGQPPPAGPPGAAPGPPAPPVRGDSFGDLVRMAPARRCVTRRSLTVRPRRRSGDPVIELRLRLRVGRGKVRVVRGRSLSRPVRLRSLPRRRFTLFVEARTRSGYSTAARRTYRPCRRR